METITQTIVKVNANEYGIEESKAKEIEAMFTPMLVKMSELEDQYNHILTLPIEPETCQMAKDLRLAYVKTRTGTEKIHKDLKAFYLAGGRFVDAFKNTQAFASGEKEKTLKAIEDHYENMERERTEKLRVERLEMIKPYTEIEPLALGHMEQAVFDNLLAGFKTAYEVRVAAEKKAEEERLAAIEAEKKRQEEMRLENEKLKKEAEERERLAEIERKKQAKVLAEQKAKADRERAVLLAKQEEERKERERLEKELRTKEEAERKEKERIEYERKKQIELEKKAARAPDKTKIIALSETIGKIELPEVKSEEAKVIIESAKTLLQKITVYLNEKAGQL
jgi:hypothetical protein